MELQNNLASPDGPLHLNNDIIQNNVKAMEYKVQNWVSSMSREYRLLPGSTPLSHKTYASRSPSPSELISSPGRCDQPNPLNHQQQGQLRKRTQRQNRAQNSPQSSGRHAPFQEHEAQCMIAPPGTAKIRGCGSCSIFGNSAISMEREKLIGAHECEMGYKMGKGQREAEQREEREVESKGWAFWLCVGFAKSGPPP